MPRPEPRDQAAALRLKWDREPSHQPDENLWPASKWEDCRAAGVFRWVVPPEAGGDGQPADHLLDGCVELARANLTVAFILSQYQAACHRLAAGHPGPRQYLPQLATGDAFTTVGLSHLTTSRQYSSQPAVLAEPTARGYRLTGSIPWVTGGRRATVLVLGATLSDGRQLLAAVPADRPGLSVAAPMSLLALNGSETGPVELDGVEIGEEEIIAGPQPQVLQTGGTAGTGSLTTTALAVGHALACVDQLRKEATLRPALLDFVGTFEGDVESLRHTVLLASRGLAGSEDKAETLRARATSLALNASQAVVTVSKGAGFVAGHPAGRLAREALFFLVWSCPQAVATQLLRGFSQCDE